MKHSDRKLEHIFAEISRRRFLGGVAGTGAALALPPQLPTLPVRPQALERRTFFLNLSHESYSGQNYQMLLGKNVYRLRQLDRGDAALAQERRTNRLLASIPTTRSPTHLRT